MAGRGLMYDAIVKLRSLPFTLAVISFVMLCVLIGDLDKFLEIPIIKHIPGDYPATMSGVTSALVDAENVRANSGQGTLIQITKGTKLAGDGPIILPDSSVDSSSPFITIASDATP